MSINGGHSTSAYSVAKERDWYHKRPQFHSILSRLRELTRPYLPLSLLGGGAGSMFLANILAKRSFTPDQFIDWAYLTSLISFFFTFSLLGSEQLIVRSGQDRGTVLLIPQEAVRLIVGSFFLFLLGYFLVDGRIFQYRLGILAAPALLSVGAVQVAYQLERSRGHLLSAQLTFNSWKIALIPLLGVASVFIDNHRAEFVMVGALVVGLVSSVWTIFRERRNIGFSKLQSDANSAFFPLMFSLGIMAILGIADRLVLEKVHEPAEFAGYVYLATVVVAPFNILASYFGFREAVRYRQECSSIMVRRDTLRVSLITGALVVGWFTLCYLTRDLSGILVDFTLWGVLGGIAIVRCGYSILSAAMGVRGGVAAMYIGNVLTMGGLVLFTVLAVRYNVSVTWIATGYLLVWCLRFATYFWLVNTCDEREGGMQAIR